MVGEQTVAQYALHRTCAGESQRFGEANDRRLLGARAFRDHGQSFQRQIVRMIQDIPCNLLEALAEVVVAFQNDIAQFVGCTRRCRIVAHGLLLYSTRMSGSQG